MTSQSDPSDRNQLGGDLPSVGPPQIQRHAGLPARIERPFSRSENVARYNLHISFMDGTTPSDFCSGAVFVLINSHGAEATTDQHGQLRDIQMPWSIARDLAEQAFSNTTVFLQLPSGKRLPLGDYVIELRDGGGVHRLRVARPARHGIGRIWGIVKAAFDLGKMAEVVRRFLL